MTRPLIFIKSLQHYDGATTSLVAADVARLIQEMKQEGVVIS